jgi:hypothetical protein
MAEDRSRYGLMVSALGAIVLAVSVFLPWYGLSFTHSGLSLARQVGFSGGGSAQSYVSGLHAGLSALTGREFTALDGHDALRALSGLLLALAGLAILDALVPLVRATGSVPEGAGRSVVLLGCVACVCVVYRMIEPPTPGGELLAMSVREGAWLALLGSLAMVIGGLWPDHEPLSLSPLAPVAHEHVRALAS